MECIRDWFGDVSLSLQVNAGPMPLAESVRTIALFATEVMPAFAAG